jgi:hypothetical protein
MIPTRAYPPLHAAAIALMIAFTACGVSEEGLGSLPDSATMGTGGAVCPARLTDLAGWPTSNTEQSCTRDCGPDEMGSQLCARTDVKTCQSRPGCVCLEEPCVLCDPCTFGEGLDTCYLPTNGPEAPSCSDDVRKGGSCAPACSRRLCTRKDGKTACLCNLQGKYACGDWGDSGWE